MKKIAWKKNVNLQTGRRKRRALLAYPSRTKNTTCYYLRTLCLEH